MLPPADASALLATTELLCRADTTTGRENAGLPALRELLAAAGAEVTLQEVENGRHNVLATWGTPRLLFSTHLDTVPPYIAPTLADGVLRGRGACDAKGQITAQLAAIAALRARGHDGFAWLGLVGEETDSIGATAAARFAPQLRSCIAAINGEPTENRLATGQRGSQQLRLMTRGVAAHSGTPELGRSAIWPLIDWLQRLRELPPRRDADLGDEIWNLGLLRGGNAPNVIPAAAEAMLFVRTLPDSTFAATARSLAPNDALVEEVSASPPDHFTRLPGFPEAIVTFGSDAPRLRLFVGNGPVVLCGPGSILVAHTADEHITGDDLRAGVDLLVAIASELLARAG